MYQKTSKRIYYSITLAFHCTNLFFIPMFYSFCFVFIFFTKRLRVLETVKMIMEVDLGTVHLPTTTFSPFFVSSM